MKNLILSIFGNIPKIKKYCTVTLSFLTISTVFSQVNIQIDSTPGQRKDISPYIYGLNPYHYDPVLRGMALHDQGINVTALRIGGDAVSSYNWEINRSTHNNDCGDVGTFPWLEGGSYFNNFNGDFIDWASGEPSGMSNTPGGGKLQLVTDANALNAYPLIQISALPKVSSANMGCLAPKNPANRFDNLIIEKPGGELSLNPNLNDGIVYADEEINYLIQTAGNSQTTNGIKGYCLENEPGLWHYTHPYVFPDSPLLGTILNTNINLAKRVKALDPGAETFGLGAFGFMEYMWGIEGDDPALDNDTYMPVPGYVPENYKYMNWLAAYLYHIKQASDAQGMRLLDVLDLHFYNEGDNNRQDSRSFWDPSYVENSWITEFVLDEQPYNAADTFHKLINDFYPGTKLSISEWGYLNNLISNAIYIADMLGAFGTKDVYLATYFGRLTGYLAGAYKIYTNYDGESNKFGSIGVKAISSDNSLVTAYASLYSNSEGTMHLVLINRSTTQQNISVSLNTQLANYNMSFVYALLSANNGAITQQTNIENINGNTFNYTLQPSGIYHLVLKDESMGTTETQQKSSIYPNPVKDKLTIEGISPNTKLIITDLNGKTILSTTAKGNKENIDVSGLPAGVYFINKAKFIKK